MGLRDDQGNLQKPDYIINLPENKHIIVDSKVTLNSFHELGRVDDEAERKALEKKFLDALRKHVTDLSGKKYEHNKALIAPDFVLMFCPIEPAFILALQLDPDFLRWAWQKRVVLAGPSTLMANLQTVSTLWAHHKQINNAMEIARAGGLLFDKFVGFMEDMESVGKNIDKTQEVYHKAKSKLTSGKGNILKSAKKLQDLGAKSKKSLPTQLELMSNEDIEIA